MEFTCNKCETRQVPPPPLILVGQNTGAAAAVGPAPSAERASTLQCCVRPPPPPPLTCACADAAFLWALSCGRGRQRKRFTRHAYEKGIVIVRRVPPHHHLPVAVTPPRPARRR